jgi:hypothetical protein
MKIKSSFFISLLVVIAVSACNDTPTLPAPTPGGGFIIETNFFPVNSGPITPVGGIDVHGDWNNDEPGAQGDPLSFDRITNSLGLASVDNGRAPAQWNMEWKSGGPAGCVGLRNLFPTNPGRVTEVTCFEQIVSLQSTADFAFSPTPIHTVSPPSTVMISGSGLSSQFGKPLLQYYDLSGTLVAQTNAGVVASDGSWLQASVPANVSQLAGGVYAGFIYNANASGGRDYVGVAAVRVIAPTPATGSLFISGGATCNSTDSGPVCDFGTIQVTIGNTTETINYNGLGRFGQGTDPGDFGGIAQSIAAAFNGDSNSSVTATAFPNLGEIDFVTKATGPSTNYFVSTVITSIADQSCSCYEQGLSASWTPANSLSGGYQ